ncbi:MAG: hypothetical protein Q9175_003825 [Cornicularia normoerica]
MGRRPGGVESEARKFQDSLEDQGDALITAIGALNEWRWSQFSGLHDFEGKLLYSAALDDSYDDNYFDYYVGGRTWIAGTFTRDEVDKRNDAAGYFGITEEEKEAWRKDPISYLAFRKKIEAELEGGHTVTIRGGDAQKAAREYFTLSMRDRLSKKPEMAEHILPDFPSLCKRLTPSPGHVEALTAENVPVIPTTISNVTSTGVTATDNTHRPVDAIVYATSFDASFLSRFLFYSINGTSPIDRWSERTSSYLSMAVDGFPSWFMSVGPNSALGTSNFIIYIARMLFKHWHMCAGRTSTTSTLRVMNSAGLGISDKPMMLDWPLEKTQATKKGHGATNGNKYG